MWLAIIAVVDKLLGIIGTWLPWQLNRSDASKKAKDAAQADMDAAVKNGDNDAYWEARARKRRA